jgi:hypothetical protein
MRKERKKTQKDVIYLHKVLDMEYKGGNLKADI